MMDDDEYTMDFEALKQETSESSSEIENKI